jgi:hypothetical protein
MMNPETLDIVNSPEVPETVASTPAPKRAPKTHKLPKATPKVVDVDLSKLPKLPKRKKSAKPQACHCGCGAMTRGGRFVPGHDAKLYGIIKRIEAELITLKQVGELFGEGVRKAVQTHMRPTAEKKSA